MRVACPFFFFFCLVFSAGAGAAAELLFPSKDDSTHQDAGDVRLSGGARCEAAGMGTISHCPCELCLLINPSSTSPNPGCCAPGSRSQKAGEMLGTMNNRCPDSLQGRRQGRICNP